jgi:hypothetical protein
VRENTQYESRFCFGGYQSIKCCAVAKVKE